MSCAECFEKTVQVFMNYRCVDTAADVPVLIEDIQMSWKHLVV